MLDSFSVSCLGRIEFFTGRNFDSAKRLSGAAGIILTSKFASCLSVFSMIVSNALSFTLLFLF